MIRRRSFNVLKGKSYKTAGNGIVVGAEKPNFSCGTLPCGRGSVTAVRKLSPFRLNSSARKPTDWPPKKVLQ